MPVLSLSPNNIFLLLFLYVDLSHSDHQLDCNNRKCTYGKLSPSYSNANGVSHSVLVEELEELLCYLNQNCVEKTREILEFLNYLKDHLEVAGLNIEQFVKQIIRSFKAKDYKKAEEIAAKFLNTETPFTKKLPCALSAICVLLRSMQEEIKEKLEAGHERFAEQKVKWKRVYRSVSVTLSLCLGLLSCFAGPHAAIVAGPLALGILLGLCDHAFESWAESMEAKLKKNKDILTATSSIGEENDLHALRNKVKRVVDVVRTVSRCSEISWTDYTVRTKVREIDESMKGLKSSLKGTKSEVKKIIVCLEKAVKIKPRRKWFMLLRF